MADTHAQQDALATTAVVAPTEFDALLKDVQADPKFAAIFKDLLRYGGRQVALSRSSSSPSQHQFAEMENLGFSRVRWNMYQQQMRLLGLDGGVLKGPDAVEFRVDPGSLSNGDSYKGYMFKLTPPEPSNVLFDLDSYRLTEGHRDERGDWSVFKSLKGNWYLYLLVNR